MGAVASFATATRPFIAIFTAAPGLLTLRTSALTLGARLVSGSAMRAASVFTETTSFAALTTTLGLPTATTTATTTLPKRRTTMAAVESNIWHQCLGHPNEHTIQAAQNIAETRFKITESLTVCDICKIKKGTKEPTRNEGKTESTERPQLLSADLLGTVTPAVRGNYHFMAKYSDHYTKFEAIYLISTKDKVLTTLVKFVQDLVMLLGLRLQHLRADGDGELFHCRLLPRLLQDHGNNLADHLPEQKSLSERDGAQSWA